MKSILMTPLDDKRPRAYPFLAQSNIGPKSLFLITGEGSDTTYCGVNLSDGVYSIYWDKNTIKPLPIGAEVKLVQE